MHRERACVVVVGLDLTPALLELGAERLRSAGVDNVILQHGNAKSLPFVDADMDALRRELDGGASTGFRPVADGEAISVTFTNTVAHATRG